MRRWHALTNGITALALAGLAAAAAQLPASAAAGAAGTARSAGLAGAPLAGAPLAGQASSPEWRARPLLKLSDRVASEAVSPRANAVYEMVARSAVFSGPYRLRRTGLASKRVTRGPKFPVSDVSLAGGYVWVSGQVIHGGTVTGLALYQVRPSTLSVIRSWRFAIPRSAPGSAVSVATGPSGTVWVGFLRTLRRIDTRTGGVVTRARLTSGQSITDVAADPARRHLYVSVEPRLGGGGVREFSARSGRLLASTSRPPVKFAVAGEDLTAVPHGVWASYRTGMAGSTIRLGRQLRLTQVTGGRGLYHWFMNASTLYSGRSLWVGVVSGDLGCVVPSTGRVRARGTLKLLYGSGQLLAVSRSRREVYATSPDGIIAIASPARCWT